MLRRYPHKAKIQFQHQLTGEEDGIVGVDNDKTTSYELLGRLEFSGINNRKYRAVFYTAQSAAFSLFEDDNATIDCMGRHFKVLKVIPYQTHTEIWLN